MVNVNARAVLLLNASYVPLGTVTIRDAVDLLMRGVVDAVDGVAARLRTPRTVFEVPSVIRLRYYVNVPHRTATWSRRAVLSRDDYTCIYCGVTVGDRRKGKILSRAGPSRRCRSRSRTPGSQQSWRRQHLEQYGLCLLLV